VEDVTVDHQGGGAAAVEVDRVAEPERPGDGGALRDAEPQGFGAAAVGGDEYGAARRVHSGQRAGIPLVHPAVVEARIVRAHHAVRGGGDVEPSVADQFGSAVQDVGPG